MHCSRHHPTASGAYVIILTYASTNDQWALFSCPLVNSSKTKPCQFSSVQLRRSIRAFTVWAFDAVTIRALTMSLSLSRSARTACARKTPACDITSSMSCAGMPVSSTCRIYMAHISPPHPGFSTDLNFLCRHDFQAKKIWTSMYIIWKSCSRPTRKKLKRKLS